MESTSTSATADTTTSEVRRSYYGIPPIKAPHWRWLIITYFFLGGIAGGSFTIATLADLLLKDKAAARAGRYLSLVAVLISPVLLTLDLGRPDRAHHMFRIVKLKSPMSLGSWALLGLGLISGPLALLQVLADLSRRERFQSARRALGIIGLPFSLFVSGYTGVLLAATNVPLWAKNAVLLGPTFVASAFSSSLAALSLLLGLRRGAQHETLEALGRAQVITHAAEAGLLVAGLLRLGRLGEPLTRGRWGRLFWPVTVGGGMLLPLGLRLSAQRREGGRRRAASRDTLGALLALIGGYSLRMVLVLAGKDSANDPAAYFEYTGTRTPAGKERAR